MVLQTLVALSSISLLAAWPTTSHETITITSAGHSFTAEVFVPRHVKTADSRYPGAVIIGTEDTKERAMVVATRLSEIGVTVMMYMHDDWATYKLHMYDARLALDSLRRRGDVRSEEIGLVAFEEATAIVPELARDTSLSFAIAASAGAAASSQDFTAKYAQARAATLLVQGVAGAVASAPMTNITQPAKTDAAGPIMTPIEAQQVGPKVTLWPVSKEQLETMGDAKSPLSAKVVSWVKEQVHVAPGSQQLPTMNIH